MVLYYNVREISCSKIKTDKGIHLVCGIDFGKVDKRGFSEQDSRAISSLSIDSPSTIKIGEVRNTISERIVIRPIEPTICIYNLENNNLSCKRK